MIFFIIISKSPFFSNISEFQTISLHLLRNPLFRFLLIFTLHLCFFSLMVALTPTDRFRGAK